MLQQLLRLARDDEAVTAVEYAVLLALILVVVISGTLNIYFLRQWRSTEL